MQQFVKPHDSNLSLKPHINPKKRGIPTKGNINKKYPVLSLDL
jgi:hypothetical protein